MAVMLEKVEIERFKQLRAELGRAPDLVDILKDARDVSSPFHFRFEWDDEVAAHQHRLKRVDEMVKAFLVPAVLFRVDPRTGKVVE